MNVHEAYSKWALTYDTVENPVRDLDRIATQESLRAVHCHTILELGCGTGKNTAFLAQISEQVLALDFSPGMLAQARTKIHADNVRFITGDITALWEFADQSIDLIVCNLVLEHVEDIQFVFTEARRCLVSGGRFFIGELHPFKQYQGIQANFALDQEQIAITAFVHHISDFVAAAKAAGFTMQSLQEWWGDSGRIKPPLLVSFMFKKSMGG